MTVVLLKESEVRRDNTVVTRVQYYLKNSSQCPDIEVRVGYHDPG